MQITGARRPLKKRSVAQPDKIRAGDSAEGQHGVFECRRADAGVLHFLEMRHAPVGEAVAAGIEQAQRHGHQPERGIGQRHGEIFAERPARRRRRMLDLLKRVLRRRRILEKHQHVNRAGRDEQRGHIQRAAPAEAFRRPARDDEGQRAAELVAGADDADGAAALQRRKPVGRDAHRRAASRAPAHSRCRPRRRSGSKAPSSSRTPH